jgi:hypothetical protein
VRVSSQPVPQPSIELSRDIRVTRSLEHSWLPAARAAGEGLLAWTPTLVGGFAAAGRLSLPRLGCCSDIEVCFAMRPARCGRMPAASCLTR